MQQLKQEHNLDSEDEVREEIEKINQGISKIDDQLENLDKEMAIILENARCGSSI
jgi:hypothetical protein